MNNLDTQFHRAQSRLLRSQGKAIRAVSSRPLFNPELATLESKDNLRRLFEYRQKLANLEAVA